MERLSSSQLDLESAGILVANFLQSWWQAGSALPPTPTKETCDELQNPSSPSSEDGLRLPATVNDGASLSSPGKHSPPICVEGSSLGTGLASGPDPSVGCRPGAVGHSDEQ